MSVGVQLVRVEEVVADAAVPWRCMRCELGRVETANVASVLNYQVRWCLHL